MRPLAGRLVFGSLFYFPPPDVAIAGAVTGMASAIHTMVSGEMVNVKYKSDRAVVPVLGVIEEEMMLPLVEAIQQLHNDYFYTHIELEVCSPGGQAMALDYCVEAMDALRARGVRFSTRALMSVSSAAAILVSLGDVREAVRGATFLYHQARTIGTEAVTAQSARQILTAVDKIDERYLSRLAGRARQSEARRPAQNAGDFTDSDWPVLEYLLVNAAVVQPGAGGAKPARRMLLQGLRKHVVDCLRSDDERPLKRLYRRLLEFDSPISAALALELRLVDALTDGSLPAVELPVREGYLAIPEWAPLYQGGRVPRAGLCRHTLVLGETGSGKTVSGVLPVVGAVMAPDNQAVSCALIIDPKRELKSHVTRLRHDGITVHEIDVEADRQRPVLNLMAGEALSVDTDLDKNQFLEAARKILIRSASLSPTSPARVLAGLPGNRRDGYWESEGSRLAMTITALVLLIMKHRGALYGDEDSLGLVLRTDEAVRGMLLDVGEAAGVVVRYDSVFLLLQGTLKQLDEAEDEWNKAFTSAHVDTAEKVADVKEKTEDGEAEQPEAVPADTKTEQLAAAALQFNNKMQDIGRQFVEALSGTELYNISPSYRRDIQPQLDRARILHSPESAGGDIVEVADLNFSRMRLVLGEVGKATFRVLPAKEIRPAPNILALANRIMTMWFGIKKKDEHRPAEQVVGLLKRHIKGGDADEIYRQVEQSWAPMAKVPDPITYLCIMGFARTALVSYADATPAHTLYFGCEPYFRSVVEYGRDEAVPVDFSAAVDAEQARTVYVFQPRLDGNEALLARALKATWFEAILSSRKRLQHGNRMPLAAYIADEFHRFITSDKVHGEQSFLDTCRSFGVCCVLACQSVSSMEHALEEEGDSWQKNKAALEILLNNTASKFFFRSTDQALQAFLDRLCPPAPGFGPLTQVRPPSTLQPGECYASLSDGRFERRQLLPFKSGKSAAAGTAVKVRA